MYEIFQELLKNAGLKPFDVSKATGISSSTLTDWKMGRSTPKQDKMQKIADYFGVTVDYLITGKKTTPAEDGSALAEFGFYHMDFIKNFNKLSDEDIKYIKYITKRLAEK
ncbi:helix-turn-helix transcriptional regulator [uncultured Eubacterium sp.]|uniref:helix-turn-helix domain-containing protein n=1 Tax=uncultured Eubacterium sp. TaxID=165185 RepID=UPI002672A51C|nr:helix-turn-helix transcriptional regulator [uncultured Eubacterium sp.]